MPVRIRLQRHGKKGKPFYWIVAADSRAKRDGKFLEKLGIYNPNTDPATVELDVDRSVQWMQNGAEPTNTARHLLSSKGAMLKLHLVKGVAKGALTEEQVEERFQAWLSEKEKSNQSKIDEINKVSDEQRAKALEAEKEVSEKRAAEITAANAPEPVEEEAAEEEAAVEASSEEAPAEETAVEEAPAEEAAAEEAPAEEAPAEEASEAEPKDAPAE